MNLKRLDVSPTSRLRVILWTVLGTLGCIAVALAYDSLNYMHLAPPERTRAIITDIVLPTVLAAPLLYFLTSKIRELAITKHELSVLASTDSLTQCLNRGAFTTLVDTYLGRVSQPVHQDTGTLLVIDADHFKRINDRFGHTKGDEALKIIANSIRTMVRAHDIFGRIGGEEFGVFLPGCGPECAEAVADRIRLAINSADFAPEGVRVELSVSVGGAVFDSAISFSELFRIADNELYRAKANGRDCVELRYLGSGKDETQESAPTLH